MGSKQENHSFHIRYATQADNVLLAELGARTFAESFAADNTPANMKAYLAASFSPEKQARELADVATKFLIVEQNDTTAGYARLKFGKAPAVIGGQSPMEIARFYACKEWIA